MIAWHHALFRSFRIGERTVSVGIETVRFDDGRPRWATSWSPDVPARLTIDEMRLIDAFRTQAKRDLLREFLALQERAR